MSRPTTTTAAKTVVQLRHAGRVMALAAEVIVARRAGRVSGVLDASSRRSRVVTLWPVAPSACSGALDEPAATSALVVPAEREEATYDEAAVQRTLELTQGYPFYLQEYGKHIWESRPILPDHREGC
jgi:hypothetical protein